MMKKKVALIIDNEHFIKHKIPIWEEKFDLKIFNPPKAPLKIKSPMDILKVIQHKLRMRKELPKLAKWADVIFCEWASHFLEWLSNKDYEAKLACRLHRYELWRHYDEIDWKKVNLVLFVSEAMEKRFLEKGKFGGKTFVTYDNIEFDDFPLKKYKETKRIGILGNVIERKGALKLIEMFHKANLPEVKLVVAGNTEDKEYLRKITDYITQNNLNDQITIEGFVKDINEWYASIDCIISNSEHEGAQTSLIEGVATGCWAISSNWDGAREIVHEKGIFENEDQLKNCIEKFYKWDLEKKNVMIKEARDIMIQKLSSRPQMHEIISDFDF